MVDPITTSNSGSTGGVSGSSGGTSSSSLQPISDPLPAALSLYEVLSANNPQSAPTLPPIPPGYDINEFFETLGSAQIGFQQQLGISNAADQASRRAASQAAAAQ